MVCRFVLVCVGKARPGALLYRLTDWLDQPHPAINESDAPQAELPALDSIASLA